MGAMKQHGPTTILIVDDDESILVLLSTFLKRQGYRVLTASDAMQGLELLAAEEVHLVVTDFMMPHVDGLAFTQKIHQVERYAHLPVILITAFGSDTVFDQSLRTGVAMTLSKPIELPRLLDLVGFATGGVPPPSQ